MNLFSKSFYIYLELIILGFFLSTSCTKNIQNKEGGYKTLNESQNSQLNFVGHWMNEGDRGKLVREVANEFEFSHQNITVNLKFPEELYNADDSLEIKFIIDQIQKPSSDWDIIRIKEHYYPIATKLNDPNWGEKYLVDFSKIPEFVNLHKSFINTPIIKQRAGNIFTGPYNEGFYWAIFVNTDVAKKIRVEVKQHDMTYDDLLGYVKAVYDYNKSNNTHIAAIFEDRNWISTETLFKRLCYSLLDNYDEIIDTKLTNKKIDAVEKGYNACEQLSKYKPIILSRMKISWGKDNDFPLKDSCLFFVNGSWMYNIWTKNDKVGIRKMVPCELPVFKPCDSYIGGYTSNWAVPKNAAHLKEAIQMVLYWCRPDVAEKWARYTKCPSGVKGNLTTSSFGLDAYENFVYAIESKYGGKKIHPVSNNYLFGDKNFRLPLRVIEVLEGSMTATQAVNEFRQKAKY
jgi:ABC-type glycerol-3-phosphate transport system substrate-binding protein